MLLAPYWVISLIFYKTMPILLFGAKATIAYALICATVSTFSAFFFITHTNLAHFAWLAVNKKTRPLITPQPLAFLAIFCGTITATAYIVAIGFSDRLLSKIFDWRYGGEEIFLFTLMMSGPPIVLYCILTLDALKMKKTVDQDIS